MMCSIHNHEMDYVPGADDIPEHWHCEECAFEAERSHDDEWSDEAEPSRCVYCNSQGVDGYCWASPDGLHHHEGD